MSELYTEQRPWGYFTILEEGETYKVKKLVVNPGHRLSLQMHTKRSEIWTVIEGKPLITCADRVQYYHKGECIEIPRETKHRIENLTDSQVALIEVQNGEYLGEDDIIRFEDDYQRIKKGS